MCWEEWGCLPEVLMQNPQHIQEHGEKSPEQYGETEARNTGWSPGHPVCSVSKGRTAGRSRGSWCFRLAGAVGLQPPLPAPPPVGREMPSVLPRPVRVTQRRVLVTAIREQHRCALPGHHCHQHSRATPQHQSAQNGHRGARMEDPIIPASSAVPCVPRAPPGVGCDPF